MKLSLRDSIQDLQYELAALRKSVNYLMDTRVPNEYSGLDYLHRRVTDLQRQVSLMDRKLPLKAEHK